jgi:thioredoxin 2
MMNGRSGVAGRSSRNMLVFFSAGHSGPARRMESLLAHLERKERHRLSVKRVDVDREPELAERFEVRSVPTLILVKGNRAVARLEGRTKAAEIEALVDRYLGDVETGPQARA